MRPHPRPSHLCRTVLLLASLPAFAAAQGGPVVAQGKFLPTGPALENGLWSLASDGGTTLAGYIDADDVGLDKGAVQILQRQPSGAWSPAGKLVPSSSFNVFAFGQSLDIDGDSAVVADPTGYGHVWAFRRSGGTWSQESDFAPPYPYPTIQSGSSLALSGSTLIVGASSAFTFEKGSNTGAIFFYERTGGSWPMVQGPVFASDWSGASQFGLHAAIDGDRAVVASNAKVYVFERSGAGNPWAEVQILTYPGGLGSNFGSTIDVEGDRIAVGAWGDDQKAGNAGAVFVYERQAGGSWLQTAKLMASDGAVSDLFGYSVSLGGSRLAVGAWGVDGPSFDVGAVYVLERQSASTWTEVAKLMHPSPAAGDQYSLTVDLADDGAIATTARLDVDGASGMGSVFLYDAETLSADVASVSLSAGGAQQLDLQGGTAQAGRLYVLVGSLSGTSPGLPLAGGFVLPLNYDAYTAYTLSAPNQPPLAGSLGVLGAGGGGHASFAIPAGSDPSLAGTIAHHAFVAVDLAAGAAVTLASNAKSVLLAP